MISCMHACIYSYTYIAYNIFINFVYVHVVLFYIFIASVSAQAEVIYKLYDQSTQLNCPNCDSNECPININGVSSSTTSTGYTIQNRKLTIPPHNLDGYGRICCGSMGQQSCYTVCPRNNGKTY